MVAFGCSGGGKKPSGQGAIPTATLPDPLPEVVIVGERTGPTNGGGNGTSGGRTTYTVVDGDTLIDIAERFGTTVEELAAINNLDDPTSLFVDQVLTIPDESDVAPATIAPAATATPAAPVPTEPPSGQTYTVQEGDIPETIAAQFGITADALMLANGITDPTTLQVGQVLVIPAPQ
jgi:LysM repeat protein